MAQTILIVEDEPTIADTLVYALKTEGFEPVWRTTGGEALAELGARTVSLVVLDVGLPDVNGFELCKKIRASWTVPVLFLTARADEIDRIVGLEIGGDDYVTKPFSPREVCARVKAILRRGAPATSTNMATFPGRESTAAGRGDVSSQMTNVSAPGPAAAGGGMDGGGVGGVSDVPVVKVAGAAKGDWFFHDPERCEVKFRGQRLELTRYEYRLLKTLLGRRGRVYSRDELMTQAWEDPGASLDRTVDAHIKTLRAKLRAAALASGVGEGTGGVDGGSEMDPIQTHRGMGYSLRT